MMSLVRPGADPTFAADAGRKLDRLRDIVASGETLSAKHFKGHELWSDLRHKRAIVGDLIESTKCAYCERVRDWKRELNVDHYRPKLAITEWEGRPAEVSDTPPKEKIVSDVGYWWLAYQWNNYALACSNCNSTWKRNLFPVSGPRQTHGEELSEDPLLLDPMTPFRTRDHLRWDRFGYISGVSERGYHTIVTCGLNRTPLVKLRHDRIVDLTPRLKAYRRATRNRDSIGEEDCRKELWKMGQPAAEFAGMVRWWFEEVTGRAWESL